MTQFCVHISFVSLLRIDHLSISILTYLLNNIHIGILILRNFSIYIVYVHVFQKKVMNEKVRDCKDCIILISTSININRLILGPE